MFFRTPVMHEVYGRKRAARTNPDASRLLQTKSSRALRKGKGRALVGVFCHDPNDLIKQLWQPLAMCLEPWV